MKGIRRSYARPPGSFIHIQGPICDECGKSRAHGNHRKCSKVRQAKFEKLRAEACE